MLYKRPKVIGHRNIRTDATAPKPQSHESAARTAAVLLVSSLFLGLSAPDRRDLLLCSHNGIRQVRLMTRVWSQESWSWYIGGGGGSLPHSRLPWYCLKYHSAELSANLWPRPQIHSSKSGCCDTVDKLQMAESISDPFAPKSQSTLRKNVLIFPSNWSSQR